MAPSRSPSPRDRAVALLERNPLRHIVGLKMLAHIADTEVRLREDESGWAGLIRFSSNAFEYDARNYGSNTPIAVLEGTSDALQLALLDELDGLERVVLKTQSPSVVRHACGRFGARPVAAFVSFTTSDAQRASGGPELATSTALTPVLCALFERNGYAEAELSRHFAAGARWFSLEQDGVVAAACFVFQNYGQVWEIAGVHTAPSQRRRGLGSRVVEAAIRHLLGVGALPRYQTSADNAASIALARSVGLVEFLRVEHLRIERRPGGA